MLGPGVGAQLASEDLHCELRTCKGRTDKWRISSTGKNGYQFERGRHMNMEGRQAFSTEPTSRALKNNEPENSWQGRIRLALWALTAFGGPIRVIHGTYDFTGP
ncbi:MAG: hypothetical protein ACUVWA_12415 [Candidatus Oleimicrobiaceae bacterium]